MVAFELAVQDLEGIEIAARIGADRIELCSALDGGGVTPSLGLLEAAVSGGVPVHVLIRPRGGGFEHTAAEIALIVRDAELVLAAGAAGVVVGGTREGRVDERLVKAVVGVAPGAAVTFHRAFDTIADRIEAVETLSGLGVRRVLTSGGRATAAEGTAELARLVVASAGRIEIMAGGGVNPQTAPALLATGVDALHASAKRVLSAVGISLGSAGDIARETTDEHTAGELRAIVDGAER